MLALAACGPTVWSGHAWAEEPDFRLMGEPTSYTDVIDAFDEGDPFDLNLHLGFRRSRTSGDIQRAFNSSDSVATAGRGSRAFRNVAKWEHIKNVLELGLDMGLYRDLALYVRLPVVLADDGKLSAHSGSMPGDLDDVRGDPSATPLFSVPFKSPTRSGLDYLTVGFAWGLLNQHRSPTQPTWILMAEGRFNVSEEQHACVASDARGTARRCLQETGAAAGELELADGGDPGVGRGTNGLRLETRASRRFRYWEPFMGIAFQIEWPGKAEDFFAPGGNLAGFMNTLPPRLGELTAGLTVIPWEHRGRFQRLAVDLRIVGGWLSEGREYGPLFDALGTSDSPHLTEPNLEGIPDGSSSLRSVEFNGLTDVQAHGRVGGRLAIEMLAARFVRFALGLGFFYDTPYLITFTDACDPDVNVEGDNDPRVGRCRSGVINPHHRPPIDLPGNRFRLDGAVTVDFFATATGQF